MEDTLLYPRELIAARVVFTPADHAQIALCRGAHNRLGFAYQMAFLAYVRDTCKKVPQRSHAVVAKSRWGCNGSGWTVISSKYCPNRLRCSVR